MGFIPFLQNGQASKSVNHANIMEDVLCVNFTKL